MAEACPDADVIIECTGVPSLVFDAMSNVGNGGVVCLTGVSSGGHTIDVDEGLLNRNMVLENVAVVGSVNANRRHYEAAADALAKADHAWLARLITAHGPARRLAEGARSPARRRQGRHRGQRGMRRAAVSGTHSHGGHTHRHADAGLHVHDPESGDAIPAVPPPRAIATGVLEIDTMLGGWERVTAGYLIEGPAPVLIETGSQSSVPVLLAALDQIGVGPAELAGVAVTHIHLDHAGGVGNVARAFPAATVYVHEKGARHLADPTKLVNSAARVYGPLLDSLYGRIDPTPGRAPACARRRARRSPLDPDRMLVAVDSPGHAKHHVGLHDSLSGVLFAGDAVGVKLPDGGVLRPSTPPPDFDLEQALTSLAKFAARRPSGIALAHYGLLDEPEELLAEAEETLRQWAETAEKAYRAG